MKIKAIISILFSAFLVSSNILTASSSDEDEMAAMQKQLNSEVLEKPFSVADEKKIEAYINDAMKKNMQPPQKAPSFWKPGSTCASIYNRGWNHYRSCRYYRRYHGRYW